jgi:hypothetical protein
MPDKLPPPYSVKVRPCTIHAGRFRWDIHEHGRPLQSSLDSFATEQEAAASGLDEIGRLIVVAPRPLMERRCAPHTALGGHGPN